MSAGHRYHRDVTATGWQAVAGVAPLAPGEVHVWRVRLEDQRPALQAYWPLLAADEQSRAGKFHYSRDQERYLITRGCLRRLLAAYLQQPPAALAFRYTDYGKPFLTPASDLSFNVSHAGGYALFAFTPQAPIGVDLELTDDTIAIERLTSRFFSPTEAQQVLALPAPERAGAFFRTWTRKEAFLKAHGQGLSLPLDQFSVPVALTSPLKISAIDWAAGNESRWSLASFTVQPGLPAAVVVEGPIRQIRYFDYPLVLRHA